MTSGNKTATRLGVRSLSLLGAALAIIAAPWLGAAHVACAHPDEGPAQIHDCDLCAKLFANPAVAGEVLALDCGLQAGASGSDATPNLLPARGDAPRGRSPPQLDLFA